MNLNFLKPLCFTLLLIVINTAYAGWVNLNTGINDDLNGVAFYGNRGIVSGTKGLYITFNGGVGAGSWSRFNITGNPTDSLLYNRTRFNHGYAQSGSGTFLACGMDTVNQSPVVFMITISSFSYSIPYKDAGRGCLRKLGYSSYARNYYAVGDSGLFVVITDNGMYSGKVVTSFTQNLTAISFSDNSSQFSMAGPGIFIVGTIINFNTISSIIRIDSANNQYNDMLYNLGTCYAVGSGYFTVSPAPFDYGYYDLGPLNALSIGMYGGYQYVGTDHGIYKSNSGATILEWQPTSANTIINCIFRPGSSSPGDLYACGTGGTVLSTDDEGGLTKPFVKLTVEGGCKGSSVPMKAIKGTSTGCSWFVNNVLVNSSCPNFNRVFPTEGSYTIKLIATNGPGLYDTSIQVMNIVNTPKVKIPYTTSKIFLCKEEPISITLDSSEANVFYTLKNVNSSSNTYGTSLTGNGLPIQLNSIPLKNEGLYYILASNNQANCSIRFADTIKIGVEHTTASLYTGLINAKINEPVNFYQNCKDAKHYEWTFQKNAIPAVSNDSNPTVRFGSLNPTKVRLICWSDSGCYDTSEVSGPVMYTELNHPDSFYSMVNNGPDIEWTGHLVPDITRMVPSKTGHLVCGYFNETQMKSYYGTSLQLTGRGGYMAKYNDDGTLKWVVHSNTNSDAGIFKSVAEDPKTGAIYIAVGNQGGVFYDNTGKYLTTGGKPSLIKIDSVGKLIWMLGSNGIGFNCLSIDKSGNILSAINGKILTSSYFTVNGIATDTIKPGPTNNDGRIIKITPQGRIKWNTAVSMQNTNASGILKTACDSLNNLYVTGSFETTNMVFYTPSGVAAFTLPGIPSNYGGRTFLAKYDSVGNLQWAIRSRTIGAINDRTIPHDMVVDNAGNVYLAGQNNLHNFGTSQVFENTDTTTTISYVGPYFLAKINNSGKCDWIVGETTGINNIFNQVTLNNNNEVVVLGMIPATSGELDIGLSSMDGNTLFKPVITPGCFVAAYNTNGNINRITSNGSSYITAFRFSGNAGFFQKENGAYYLAQYINVYENQVYKNFGTSIANTNNIDGMICKFYENSRPDYSSTNTQSNISITQCDSFYAPSGQLIVSSGLYDDIIPNSVGGDSIIQINLTLLATKSFVSIKGCDSVPYRNSTYYTSGNYKQTLLNSNGCDSTIYIQAIIGKTTCDTLFVSACDSFVLADTIFKSSGWFTQRLKSIEDCDSVIVFNLNIRQSTSSTVQLTGCDSVSFRSISYYSNGSYIQKLQNAVGCDSTIYITVNLGKTIHDTLYLTACDSIFINHTLYRNSGWYNFAYLTHLGCDSFVTFYLDIHSTTRSYFTVNTCDSYELNGVSYTMDGVYVQVLPNTMGCDSVITLTLNILNDITSVTLSGCDSIEVNLVHYYESGLYEQHLTNQYGCDSLVKLSLTIPKFDTTVTITGDTLSSNTFNATYQWINCSNETPIPGANQRSFTPTFSGHFKVEIISNGCKDTSDCYTLIRTGIATSKKQEGAFKMYPNPNNGHFKLGLDMIGQNSKAIIHNIAGQLVFEKDIQEADRELNFDLNLETGIYFLKVLDTSGSIVFYDKFVVLPQN